MDRKETQDHRDYQEPSETKVPKELMTSVHPLHRPSARWKGHKVSLAMMVLTGMLV